MANQKKLRIAIFAVLGISVGFGMGLLALSKSANVVNKSECSSVESTILKEDSSSSVYNAENEEQEDKDAIQKSENTEGFSDEVSHGNILSLHSGGSGEQSNTPVRSSPEPQGEVNCVETGSSAVYGKKEVEEEKQFKEKVFQVLLHKDIEKQTLYIPNEIAKYTQEVEKNRIAVKNRTIKIFTNQW